MEAKRECNKADRCQHLDDKQVEGVQYETDHSSLLCGRRRDGAGDTGYGRVHEKYSDKKPRFFLERLPTELHAFGNGKCILHCLTVADLCYAGFSISTRRSARPPR